MDGYIVIFLRCCPFAMVELSNENSATPGSTNSGAPTMGMNLYPHCGCFARCLDIAYMHGARLSIDHSPGSEDPPEERHGAEEDS